MPRLAGCYDPDPDYARYYQGDVLRDVPFPSWPTLLSATQKEKWAILRPIREGKRPTNQLPSSLIARAASDVPDRFQISLDRKEFVMASCQLRTVLILTRGCQLDNPGRKHLVVAPVTAIEELLPEERKPEMLEDLRAGNIPHRIYLPAIQEALDESFADLLRLTYLHRSFLPDSEVRSKLIARLSSDATSRLQMGLSRHFGNSFGFDHEDECTQDGWYSCSACFYNGREVHRLIFRKGMIFGPCALCGENAEYVKIPGESPA